MIIGIGTDIIDISRIEKTVNKQDDRFLSRLLTKEELEYVPESKFVAHVAKRWAAKEAISKALGTGIGEFCSFQDISIYKEAESGQPLVKLSENLLEKLQIKPKRAIKVHLSLSDEKAYALAYAIVEQVEDEN